MKDTIADYHKEKQAFEAYQKRYAVKLAYYKDDIGQKTYLSLDPRDVERGQKAVAEIDDHLNEDNEEAVRTRCWPHHSHGIAAFLMIMMAINTPKVIWSYLLLKPYKRWGDHDRWHMACVYLLTLATIACILMAHTAANTFARQEASIALTAVSLLYVNLLNWTAAFVNCKGAAK